MPPHPNKWVSATITFTEWDLATQKWGKETSIDGQRLGFLGVYFEDEKWTVCHCGVKRMLCRVATEHDAKRVAEKLRSLCQSKLVTSSLDNLKHMLPLWVEGWLRKCHQNKRYEEPEATA